MNLDALTALMAAINIFHLGLCYPNEGSWYRLPVVRVKVGSSPGVADAISQNQCDKIADYFRKRRDDGISNGNKLRHKSRYYILGDSKSQDKTKYHLKDEKQKHILKESTVQKLNKAYLSILDDAEDMLRSASHMRKKWFAHASKMIFQNKVSGNVTSRSVAVERSMLKRRKIADDYSVKSSAENKSDEEKENEVYPVNEGEKVGRVNTVSLSYNTSSVIPSISKFPVSFMTSESSLFPESKHSKIESNGVIPPRRLALFRALRKRFRKTSTRSKETSTLSNQFKIEEILEQTFSEIYKRINIESTTYKDDFLPLNELLKISQSGSSDMIETMKKSENNHYKTDLETNLNSTSTSLTSIYNSDNDIAFIHNDSLSKPVPITYKAVVKYITKITALPIGRKLQKWFKGDLFNKCAREKNHLNNTKKKSSTQRDELITTEIEKNNYAFMTYANPVTLPMKWLATDLNRNYLNYYVLGINTQTDGKIVSATENHFSGKPIKTYQNNTERTMSYLRTGTLPIIRENLLVPLKCSNSLLSSISKRSPDIPNTIENNKTSHNSRSLSTTNHSANGNVLPGILLKSLFFNKKDDASSHKMIDRKNKNNKKMIITKQNLLAESPLCSSYNGKGILGATARSPGIERDRTISKQLTTRSFLPGHFHENEKTNNRRPLLVLGHQLDMLPQKFVYDREKLIAVPRKKKHRNLSKYRTSPKYFTSRESTLLNDQESNILKLSIPLTCGPGGNCNVPIEEVVEEKPRTKGQSNEYSEKNDLSDERESFEMSTSTRKSCKCTCSKKLIGRTEAFTRLADESSNENTEYFITPSSESSTLNNERSSESSSIECTNKLNSCNDNLTSPGSNDRSEHTDGIKEEGKPTLKTYTSADVGGDQEEVSVMPISASRPNILSKKKCTCSLLCTLSDENGKQRQTNKTKAVKHDMKTSFTLLKRFSNDNICTSKSSKGTSKMKKESTRSLSDDEIEEKNSVTYSLKTDSHNSEIVTSESMDLEEYSDDLDTSPSANSSTHNAKITEFNKEIFTTTKKDIEQSVVPTLTSIMSNALYIRNCTCLSMKRRPKQRMYKFYEIVELSDRLNTMVNKPKAHTTERVKYSGKMKNTKALDSFKFTSTFWPIDAGSLEKNINCVHKDSYFPLSTISCAKPKSLGFNAKKISIPTRRRSKSNDVPMLAKLQSGCRKMFLNRSLRTPIDSNRPTFLVIQPIEADSARSSKLIRLDSVTKKNVPLTRNFYAHNKKKFGVRTKGSDQTKSTTVKTAERITVPHLVNVANDIASVKIFIGRENNQ